MVDTGATDTQGPIVDILPEKEDYGDFTLGAWKR